LCDCGKDSANDLLLEVQRLRLLKAEHERQIETLMGMLNAPGTTSDTSTTASTTDSAGACGTQRG